MFKIRILDEIVRGGAFVAASLVAVLIICEYVLKPLWHLIQIR